MAERVWDRFLTEQDRASLSEREPKRRGFGRWPALLLIDFYRWVFGDEPQPLLEAKKTWPGSCGLAAWDAIPPTQALLKAGREAGMPIVFSTGLDEGQVKGWGGAWQASLQRVGSPEEEDRNRRRYQIIDELTPLPGETVIHKASPSVFWGTPLVGHLTHLGVDTLIVAGESTSGCVRASVVDAATYRYKVTVVEECVFDRVEASHAMNLFDINAKSADVLPLAEVLEYIENWRLE